MKVNVRGQGNPEVAVVYCTHGDETAGKKAVEKLLNEDRKFRKAVKFVFANEKAFENRERFVDTDLNRSFPGNSNSDSYEERLASEMMRELKGLKALDIHETSASPVPFALFTWMDEEVIELLRCTGVDKAVEISYTPGCGINYYGGVEVEVGPRGSEEAAKQAYKILERFLINNGVLKGEEDKSCPELYTVYGTESCQDKEWGFIGENFRQVEKGEIFAKSTDNRFKKAEQSFVPVLMSENYNDILGFKAVRNENLSKNLFNRGNQK